MRDSKLIQLYITNMCNSHCRTCSIWKNVIAEELSLKDIKKVIDAYPDADFVIGGGEAILHSDIVNILKYLRDNKVKYTLLSNCVSFILLKSLVEEFDVPSVTISFDGSKHDYIRGIHGNAFDIADFVEWCKDTNRKVKLSYTFSRYNEETFVSDMYMIKNKFQMENIYFCLAQDMDLLETNKQQSPVAKDISEVLRFTELLTEKDLNHVMIMNFGGRKKCNSQSTVHTIYSDGSIVRCQSYMSKDILGNVKALESKDIKGILDNVENIDCPYDKKCNLLCQRRYD